MLSPIVVMCPSFPIQIMALKKLQTRKKIPKELIAISGSKHLTNDQILLISIFSIAFISIYTSEGILFLPSSIV